MLRRLGVLWIALALAGCAPFADRPTQNQPTVVPAAQTQPTISSAEQPAATLPPARTQPTSSADAATLQADAARIDAAKPLPRDRVALVEQLKGVVNVPAVARTTPLQVKVGDVESFWVADNISNESYQVKAQLRYAGPVALMYVDTALNVPQDAIERSAQQFEQSIYPRDHQLFGTERTPGVDGDPRITILTTNVRGAGGYFSSADSYVKAVNRFSNEREMFVISAMPGTETFASTLAHEFQHMIEANEQPDSPSWFNEGFSTLAEDLNGFVSQNTALVALRNPNVQLTAWSTDAAQTGEHYGTSQLFMRYFYEQYSQNASLADLIKANAGVNVNVFAERAAQKRPDIASFADVVADWAVANLLNDPAVDGGRYAYKLLPGTVKPEQAGQNGSGLLAQYGAKYLQLPAGARTLSFDGATSVPLSSATPQDGRYAWWSNRGDNSMSSLTRAFDLRGVQQATLQFAAQYELENDWDYGFVTVSADNGSTWTTLQGSTTTTTDPQGNNYGNGITGVSGAPGQDAGGSTRGKWVDERVDLSAYVGKQILLRFLVVNDDAFNAPGMLIDNIRIPELNYRDSAETDDGGWQAQGFVRTTAELPQQWTLRLVRQTRSGTAVERVPVDAQGHASVQINNGDTATLVVIPSTNHTTEPAQFRFQTMQ